MVSSNRVRFIAIAGNIGAGKTTLASLLARSLGWKPLWEPVISNPYLEDFYQDMRRWGFHSQVFFLITRMRQHYKALWNPQTTIVQDRTIYEDAEVFAKNLYLMGFMEEREWLTYCELYEMAKELLRPPDLIIYLRAQAETLHRRICKRQRVYEHSIPIEYLKSLEMRYEAWRTSFQLSPFLVIDTEEIDFVDSEEGKQKVLEIIKNRLEQIGAT